ncbi:hypothetical protein EC991_010873 [Linnemannia zychae]|nr:hypothetical protein EC991_010873 [Linnemannia zychae]
MKAPKKSTSNPPKPAPSPATSSTTSPNSPPSNSKNVFRIHGVNVLNRKNVDSIARLTALERRRATHILDERQRRDTMNQLLTELANLVRESATDISSLDTSSLSAYATVTNENGVAIHAATKTSTPDTILSPSSEEQSVSSSPPPEQPPAPTTTATTAFPILNADGTERRPPVKSNSITTLRNAIAEIHRLRAYAGLQNIIVAQPSSCNESPSAPSVSSPPSVTSSPSRSSSPPLRSDMCSLSTLATLACQSECQSRQSHEMSSPCASPQQKRRSGGARSKSKRDTTAIIKEEEADEDEEMGKGPQSPDFSMSMRMVDSRGANQLYSPPLSPSSPTATQFHHFSSLPMSMSSSPSPMAAFAQPSPSPLYPHYYNNHQQQHQYQSQHYYHQQHYQQAGLTPPTLPPLFSMVSSSMESEPTDTDNQYNHSQSHHY